MSHIAIVGAGLIGRAWAFVFARAGFDVRVWDLDPQVLERLDGDIAAMVAQTAPFGQAGADPDATAARIRAVPDLAGALDGAELVQESGPEVLAIKRELFARLDGLAAAGVILASSSSALMASAFAEGLPGASRCLVGHPVNPPHLVPVVEIAPAPFTDPVITARARDIYARAGQVPVMLKREIDGFILNRLQAVVLAESLRLIEQGYVDPQGLDDTIRHGLGRRWAFMGPMETINLNAPGGAGDYLARYGRMMAGLAKTSARDEAFTAQAAAIVGSAFPDTATPQAIRARQDWRDGRLAALARHLADQPQH
ncbi:3-hydroxyacyl-CoA dehydrogenase [Paracoccus denitrificans]|jgi:3-hydroxyacyl-CoA dehydrogenase|uniref:3-hydroxyacyl-CoA dehydrogenase, NAD-binding protein n=1 Tax=Paracoccus denitrificans (strain Pd 1222) TaxID=318586 RepID=A1B801_PARDP|nr:3-hydroxyacyl-CoA dehydrogenase [Paracoccus denitrificans]ABL71645.1 3-hydroxyacyl-CoA dehydrogenase, NAD-binding protein [Paracoccus denitrificans PD1222]MBB4629791.1 3-hydroxyacyl-CoA dehydrogenase [Paracoccus denitrificans]MCU7431227.1 3-hydroxyacyl-CoA dehydrogenase [Paracoccus denitrificans]QAR28236.1 3-hydroxyacyl-CoA dehydrogenase [Paracoccus denitrificans]UPV97973.1 3-hydroxyacyl-CoA dehydrogenase [Paracoccus denitrificans]